MLDVIDYNQNVLDGPVPYFVSFPLPLVLQAKFPKQQESEK